MMLVVALIGAALCVRCEACGAFQSGKMKCIFQEKSVDAKCDGFGKWQCAMKLANRYTGPGAYQATGTCHNATLKCPLSVWDVKVEKDHYTLSQCVGVCRPDDDARKKSVNKRLAIGLGVGLGAAAVIAVVVVVVICRKRRREARDAEPAKYT
jgi:hypothetical protein